MSQRTILEATAEDAPQLLQYMRELYAEPHGFNPVSSDEFDTTEEELAESIEKYASQENSVYLLAMQDQQIVGEVTLKGYTQQALRHNAGLGISVHRRWRRQGIGRQLMEEAIEWAKQTDIIERIELYTYATNLAAQALYRQLGFVQEGLRKGFIHQHDERIDDLLMALYLW